MTFVDWLREQWKIFISIFFPQESPSQKLPPQEASFHYPKVVEAPEERAGLQRFTANKYPITALHPDVSKFYKRAVYTDVYFSLLHEKTGTIIEERLYKQELFVYVPYDLIIQQRELMRAKSMESDISGKDYENIYYSLRCIIKKGKEEWRPL